MEQNPVSELNKLRYGSFQRIFEKFNSLQMEYGNLSPEVLSGIFGQVGGFGNLYTPNPYIQNTRVKSISSSPIPKTKDEVAEMLKSPDSSEQELRQVEHALEYSAYPMLHTRTVYQSLATYRNYITPFASEKGDAKKADFWREWKLLEKLRQTLDIRSKAHEVFGQALQEGKVFYTPRISVDKPHNAINHAFLQQLPSDYVKIVGFNNKSKYTVAFNLMYFTRYGTDWRQYGDLLLPYIRPFNESVYPRPSGVGTKLIYAERTSVDLKAAAEKLPEADVYCQNGIWYYWVTLPADKVFTFEADDTTRTAISPFSGLFIDMIQLSVMEAIQLSLIQNPLVSLLHGEIPYWDERRTEESDAYKLSSTGKLLFEAFWDQMLAKYNTSGIGLYMAPLENMKLESLAEAPSAMDIVSKGYQDTMSKAGLTGIIPSSDEARAGAVQVSLAIESRFSQAIYDCWERMMNCIIDGLHLKYSWRFRMFGTLADEKELESNAMRGMEHGILPDTLVYDAIHDRSILEDLAVSEAIAECGLMDLRQPLITSYSAKQADSGLPPQGGRPKSEGITSEGQEQDRDQKPEGVFS